MNQNTFLLLLLLLIPFVSFGTNNIESIKDSILECNGEDKAEALYKIGGYYYLNNSDSALVHFERSLAEYKKVNNGRGIARNYGMLASIYTTYGMFDTAVTLIYKEIEWGEENNDDLVYHAYLELANTFFEMGQTTKAAGYYQKAIQGNQPVAKMAAFANFGMFYLDDEKYDSASYYLIGALGQYYLTDTGQDINKYNIASINFNLASVDFGKKEYKKGINRLNESLKTYRQIGDFQSVAKVFVNLGNNYGKLNKPEISIEYYLKAKVIADSLQFILVQEEVYRELTDYYREIGDFENALVSLMEYEKIHDSLQSKSYLSSIAEMEAKYSLKEKNRLIIDLKKEKQNLTVISFSVIVGLFFWVYQ